MNGIHDMGGMQDMGAIRPEKDEPVFHAAWEGRAFAMVMAVDGDWPEGSGRSQRESLPPEDYLRMSYYDKWATGLQRLLEKSGMVTREEIESGKPNGRNTKAHLLTAAEVAPMVAKGSPSTRNVPVAPQFHAGQRVRARNIHPVSHTRLPRYARGRIGTIMHDHGVFLFPDSVVLGQADKPQHVYSVRFAASELWGEQANRNDSIYVDLWDDYLAPAG